ncbi:MAG: hypothetical protein ACUVRH_04720 [Candidatus Bipolaricaulia bacterium]
MVNERKELLQEPYVVRLGGWTLDRYLTEAPEHQIWELVRGETAGEVESHSISGFWMEAQWLLKEPLPSAAECLQAILKGKAKGESGNGE